MVRLSARWVQPTPRLVGLLLALVTLAVYSAVTQYGFIQLDDDGAIVYNPRIREGLSWAAIRWAFTTCGYGPYWCPWCPMVWLTHLLDFSLYGMNPGAFHLTNIVLHTASVVLLYAALLSMTGRLWESAMVGALFALHPMHVESVAWIVERKDMVSGFFWFASLGLYARYAARPGKGRYLALAVCYALGLMSKPTLVTLPVILLLLDYWPLRRLRPPDAKTALDGHVPLAKAPWRTLVAEKLPFIAMAFILSAATFITAQTAQVVASVGILVRLANACIAYVAYISKLVWPVGLAVFYPYDSSPSFASAAAALIILAATSVALIRVRRTCPFLLVGWLWFLFSLVPVIGIVQTGMQAMADRYASIPYVGLYIACVWGLSATAKKLRLSPAVLGLGGLAVLVCLGLTTAGQIRLWRNSEALFRHTLRHTHNNAIIHENLGVYLLDRNRPREALVQFIASARILPLRASPYYRIGRTLAVLGNERAAVSYLARSLLLDPTAAGPHHWLGLLSQTHGDTAVAMTNYLRAIELDPMYWQSHEQLALLYQQLGRHDEAERHFRHALASKLRSPSVLYHTSLFFAHSCRADSAERYLSLYLVERPDEPLGVLERGIARQRLGRHVEAADDLRLAVRTMPQNGRAHHYLGLSLQQLGQNDSSQYHLAEAVRLGYGTGAPTDSAGRPCP